MDKIALFDFCETIVDFQSADAFCEFVKTHEKIKHTKWGSIRVFLNRTKLIKIVQLFYKDEYVNKIILLKEIKGLPKSRMEDLGMSYYKEIIKSHLIPVVVNEINQMKEKGYKIFIVSGGYDIYLKYFVDEYFIDGCICTELLFNNDVFSGKYIGHDCLGNEKVNRLKRYFGITNDFTNMDSVSYSDSKSDLPLLKFSKKGVVVSKKKELSWIKENKLETLIWD